MRPLVKPMLVAIWLLTCLGMTLSVQAWLAHRSGASHNVIVSAK
jgi:hypothetical protein